MNNNFENFFSVKIYRKKIANHNIIREEIESICGNIFKLIRGNNSNQVNQPLFSDPYLKSDFITENNLSALKKEILNCSHEYLKEYNCESSFPLTIKRSWITFCPKDTWGHLHHHTDCMIAGVYYFEVEQLSGKLRLYSPLQFNKENSNYLDIEPELGTVVMFPGWMGHEILPNKSDNMRISIAFDLA